MPKEIKSLVAISQDILSRHLEGLDDVGSTPYSLLKPALRKATPKQLFRIEKANPHLRQECNELWLNHCLSYVDIREAYHQGEHQDPTKWRRTYMQRFKETERKRELISAKVKKQYTKIQNEKAAKSIKVLSGYVPTQGRSSTSYDNAKRNQTSKLFQETRRAANRSHAMYRPTQQRSSSSIFVPNKSHRSLPLSTHTIVPVSKPTSKLSKAYNNLKQQHLLPPHHFVSPPLIPPPSHPTELPGRQVEKKHDNTSQIYMKKPTSIATTLPTTTTTTPVKTKRRRLESPISTKETQSRKPAALVNYDIFKQLS
ncbi:RNA polymerase II transcription factor SIII subunit A-domain-containing protein [Circinella umbellata]|nr:RNA polymerase II transcription factor SIII subunit A-domain-containing protein [Circinella umbellata]